ncbi:hypothetical protein JCM18900_120 [Psychrobacter sp. JCM 18900]|nr:hypothetical protein JCM18900_120 [Psychrobacter sp. JCM 18900]
MSALIKTSSVGNKKLAPTAVSAAKKSAEHVHDKHRLYVDFIATAMLTNGCHNQNKY